MLKIECAIMRKPYVSPNPYDHLQVLEDGCSIKAQGEAVVTVMIDSGQSESLIKQKLRRLCQRNQHLGFCAAQCLVAETDMETEVIDDALTDGMDSVLGPTEPTTASGVIFQSIRTAEPLPFGHSAGSFGEYELVD